MRLLLAILLAVAMLPAQARTIDICDRTPQVRDAILSTLSADDCAAVDAERMASVTSLWRLELSRGQVVEVERILTYLQAGDFDGLSSLGRLNLAYHSLTTLPAGVFDGLTSLSSLELHDNQLTTLPAGVFDGLHGLRTLLLHNNQLASLPAGLFDGLPVTISDLRLDNNQLTTLPAGLFDAIGIAGELRLDNNQLTTLPAGLFDGQSLVELHLNGNQLTTLPAGVFDGLRFNNRGFAGSVSDRALYLNDNQLTTLRAGVFDGLLLDKLHLNGNQLTTLPAGVFDGLSFGNAVRGRESYLYLNDNQLTTLPAGVFDGLTKHEGRANSGGAEVIDKLYLDGNQLTTFPAGVFDGLTELQELHLQYNHLVGLRRSDPLFAELPSRTRVFLTGQTEPGDTPPPPPPPAVRIAAAVPLMLSTLDSTRQGFVRMVNESAKSGSVRVFAFDDGGHAPGPVEIPLGAGQVVHFNSNDLENGNARKGIEGGVGGPVQGDWRLDVESALPLRVLAFVRTTDGFLTAMHDVLPRNDEGRLVAQIFNPGSNMNQESRLRLVNTGAEAAGVSIKGVDDQGNDAGPVTLTLSAGESRTLSAFDLENGAQGLTGTLGDGAGKWRLFIGAGGSVVGMGLLASVTGHLTNISTAGVADE